ncbi:MAG: NAD(+) synthase [Oscillospiraceae bacterium]|nr:NAD(+) synthase [Oscillospiraceae bacterium]
MQHGFARIGVAIPKVTVADCEKNLAEIKALVTKADAAMVDVLAFPELALTGATCGDLFFQSTLLEAAERALGDLITHTKGLRPLVAVGLPMMADAKIWNCVAVISDGTLLGLVPKTCAPDQTITYLFNQTIPISQELCFSCTDSPSLTVGIDGDKSDAAVLLNLAADPEQIGGAETRRSMIAHQSAQHKAIYVYAGTGTGESSTDAVFSGHGLIAENGHILLETQRFQPDSHLSYCDADIELLQKERCVNTSSTQLKNTPPDVRRIPFHLPAVTRPLVRTVSSTPHLPPGPVNGHCEEIFALQTAALRQRLDASRSKTAVLGISGGLDSTLALLVTANAYKVMGRNKSDILAITMPGFGTTARTHANAECLMKLLGVTTRDIPIEAACTQHFADIGHDPAICDTTYENAQARERTQILMDIANQTGGLVIGTGNLSEMALGWSTYGGDHMSMYAVSAGVPKTLVRKVTEWLAQSDRYTPELTETLQDILRTPVSPELLPTDAAGKNHQNTEAIIGPYELHDFFLYYVVRCGFSPAKIVCLAEAAFAGEYNRAAIIKWLEVFYRRFFAAQFKRSCTPDGPQVCAVSLSPRSGWQMPSDAAGDAWLRELERLK